MSDAPPAGDEIAALWWKAWFAVWSPPVAWGGAIAVLMLSGLLPWQCSAVAGLAITACGVVGVFVGVACALDSLDAESALSHMTGRERARLMCLGLLGSLVSLLGYGCLFVLGGLVVLVSLFRDLQLG